MPWSGNLPSRFLEPTTASDPLMFTSFAPEPWSMWLLDAGFHFEQRLQELIAPMSTGYGRRIYHIWQLVEIFLNCVHKVAIPFLLSLHVISHGHCCKPMSRTALWWYGCSKEFYINLMILDLLANIRVLKIYLYRFVCQPFTRNCSTEMPN